MEKVNLEAKIREKVGKGSSGRLRRTGYIPAVLYGEKEEPQPLIVNTKDLEKALSTEAGENVIISLKVGDRPRTVIVKELQTDPVRGDLLHVDLCQISLREKLKAAVPIEVRGEAPGVKEGGILQYRLREIEVECLPTEIPESIPVDIGGLGIGDSLHIKDLKITGDIKILMDKEETVVSIVPPTVEEVAPPTPEEVVTEPEVIGEEKEVPPKEVGEAKEAKPPAKEEKKSEKAPKAKEKKK
ncbi:50S ribosomal protein L25/general stress protein Ctc [bacterium]|nr:50S ribosomal protein L25/general stress protein Ctc [bacterium]MCG2678010.1 50S ribosomal protein L25/general stress protein Ctc [bacterium]